VSAIPSVGAFGNGGCAGCNPGCLDTTIPQVRTSEVSSQATGTPTYLDWTFGCWTFGPPCNCGTGPNSASYPSLTAYNGIIEAANSLTMAQMIEGNPDPATGSCCTLFSDLTAQNYGGPWTATEPNYWHTGPASNPGPGYVPPFVPSQYASNGDYPFFPCSYALVPFSAVMLIGGGGYVGLCSCGLGTGCGWNTTSAAMYVWRTIFMPGNIAGPGSIAGKFLVLEWPWMEVSGTDPTTLAMGAPTGCKPWVAVKDQYNDIGLPSAASAPPSDYYTGPKVWACMRAIWFGSNCADLSFPP
jgi:hypothetical protein